MSVALPLAHPLQPWTLVLEGSPDLSVLNMTEHLQEMASSPLSPLHAETPGPTLSHPHCRIIACEKQDVGTLSSNRPPMLSIGAHSAGASPNGGSSA